MDFIVLFYLYRQQSMMNNPNIVQRQDSMQQEINDLRELIAKLTNNNTNNNTKYQCKYCNKVFSTNSNMHKHMKRSCKIRKASGLTTETKRKRYNCDRCNKYSTDCRQNFWSHQNRTKKCGNKDEI